MKRTTALALATIRRNWLLSEKLNKHMRLAGLGQCVFNNLELGLPGVARVDENGRTEDQLGSSQGLAAASWLLAKDWPRMILGLRFIRFCFVLTLLAFMPALVGVAKADDSNPIGDFFSFLKAPDISLPHIDIVPFWTDDLKRARNAYMDGDYAQAAIYFRKSSQDGNMVADWYLGNMFRLGQGVPVDQATAYSYYSRCAENYDPEEPDNNRLRIEVDSQLRVADYLRTGIRNAKLGANPQSAAHTYLRIATSYAHPRALYALGTMSLEGEGMAKNPTQGLKWLNAAVRKHSPEAAAYLGELYKSGNVVRQDDTRALMWFLIAAQLANRTENPIIFSKLNQLRTTSSEEVRLEAEARARVWLEENPVRPGE